MTKGPTPWLVFFQRSPNALGDLWENTSHGVGPLVIFHFGHGQNFAAICSELAAKEEVHEVDLEENIGEVEELTGKEAEGIEVVIMPVFCEMVDKHCLSIFPCFLINNGDIQPCDEHLE